LQKTISCFCTVITIKLNLCLEFPLKNYK